MGTFPLWYKCPCLALFFQLQKKRTVHLETKRTFCSDFVTLRTFAPKSSHVQIFSKLLLSLDNDQLMSEKQKKNEGAAVLISEIKRVGNAVFLEVLVMEGEIGYMEDSRQCLFIHFIASRPI